MVQIEEFLNAESHKGILVSKEDLPERLWKAFEKCDKNEEWYQANKEAIDEMYEKHYIAILEPERIMAYKTMHELMFKLERMPIDTSAAFIIGIPPKDEIVIL